MRPSKQSENRGAFLICPDKAPVHIKNPNIAVSKIRIYLTMMSSDLKQRTHSSNYHSNKLDVDKKHSNNSTTSVLPQKRVASKKLVDDNFIEILFHLPNVRRDKSD